MTKEVILTLAYFIALMLFIIGKTNWVGIIGTTIFYLIVMTRWFISWNDSQITGSGKQ